MALKTFWGVTMQRLLTLVRAAVLSCLVAGRHDEQNRTGQTRTEESIQNSTGSYSKMMLKRRIPC